MTAAIWLVLLFGLAIGSFLNVCITRLPADESVVTPGSRCRSCRTPIRWFDNIPVVSYLALTGRCRQCQSPIGVRYPVVELTTALAFGLQAYVHLPDLALVGARLVLTALLVVLFWTDFETRRLPNALTIPGTVLGLASSVFLPPGFVASLSGIALGGGVLFLLRWLWLRATGVDGMGLGDVKMLAMIGAFLGWQQVVVVLFLSSVTGAIAGVALVVAGGRSMQASIPFGTFLAASALVASLVGEDLFAWYLATLQ
jgi:leader peptidase (prepilin peptidase) / N-methyltransferase